MDCPMDYSFCKDRVTVYHYTKEGIVRTVYPHAYLQIQDKLMESSHGPELERAFLLVIPGKATLSPGDRVYLGEGPEMSMKRWGDFIPANTDLLCQIQYVQPYFYMGSICHTEAGRNLSTLYQ